MKSHSETFSVVSPCKEETDHRIVRLDSETMFDLNIEPGDFVCVENEGKQTVVQCWKLLTDGREDGSIVIDSYVQSNIGVDNGDMVTVCSIDDVSTIGVADKIVLSFDEGDVETLSKLAQQQLLNSVVTTGEELPVSTSKTYVATRESETVLNATVESVDSDDEFAVIRDRTRVEV